MAEQATDTVGSGGAVASTGSAAAVPHGGSGHSDHNPGRPVSWAGTVVVIIGFIIGGIAFVPSPHWTFVWVGAGVAVVGCLILAFSKAMSTDWY